MEHRDAQAMLMTMFTAISAGLLLIVFSRKVNVSAIVVLLMGGIALGPQGLGIVHPESLGDSLGVLVSLAVAVILFEGGLSLDLKGFRTAPRVIRRLLTLGVVITWLTTTLLIELLFPYDIFFSLLAASLVIVTGPTVIAPMVKRIQLKSNLSNILRWEGVLIDPIGVFIAVLCFEWVEGTGKGMALANFGFRVATGLCIGGAGGAAVFYLIKRKLVPRDMLNSFVLAWAVMIFGVTELVGIRFNLSEAGILSVVVAGFTLGVLKPPELKEIRAFKAEITDLMIGMLFILLAARLDLHRFLSFGLPGGLAVAGVMLLVRPMNIFASSMRTDLTLREKLFLSWVAPRGIVAASMASLFTIRLSQQGVPQAGFLETFTYSVIISTVLLQGLSAGSIARLMRLKRPTPTGWLIVGAHTFGRRIARFIHHATGEPVLLLDSNPRHIAEAQREELPAMHADARDTEAVEALPQTQELGNLLALTDNEDLNTLLCERWSGVYGRERVFRWRLRPDIDRFEPQADGEASHSAGRTIWPDLPKPSLLSTELLRGESTLWEVRRPADKPGASIPLIAVRNGTPILDPESRLSTELGGWQETLYLKRESNYLIRSLRHELYGMLETRTRRGLYEALMEMVVEQYPQIPRAAVVQELIEREERYPTALGHGIAVPHAYCRQIPGRICAVARLEGGIDFEAPDGMLVRLVFLLLSPPGDPEGHLATLAEIARLCSDEGTRDRLLEAGNATEFHTIVREFDTRNALEIE